MRLPSRLRIGASSSAPVLSVLSGLGTDHLSPLKRVMKRSASFFFGSRRAKTSVRPESDVPPPTLCGVSLTWPPKSLTGPQTMLRTAGSPSRR